VIDRRFVTGFLWRDIRKMTLVDRTTKHIGWLFLSISVSVTYVGKPNLFKNHHRLLSTIHIISYHSQQEQYLEWICEIERRILVCSYNIDASVIIEEYC
jgi:hypothetical protein